MFCGSSKKMKSDKDLQKNRKLKLNDFHIWKTKLFFEVELNR